MNKCVFIDFDSTIISCESLDELAKICTRENKAITDKIRQITDFGMNGSIDIKDSILQRLEIIKPKKVDLEALILLLKTKVDKDFADFLLFLKKNAYSVYILSGSFIEIIYPILKEYNIPKQNIFTNKFSLKNNILILDKNKSKMIEFDSKSKIIQGLKCKKSFMIGDGITDLQTKLDGCVDTFIYFNKYVEREKVKKNSDYNSNSFVECEKIIEYHNCN